MTSQTICEDCPISVKQVEEILQEYFKTSVTLDFVEGKVISKGLGFLSDVIRLNLTWKDPTETLPKKVIVKAPKVDHMKAILDDIGGARVDDNFVPKIHETECRALELLARGKQVPIPIPQIYGTRLITVDHPGLIVMEDMGDRSRIANNIADGVNITQWRNIVIALADLHAWSMVTDVQWRDQLPGIEGLIEMFTTLDQSCEVACRTTIEKYPEYFGSLDAERIAMELRSSNMLAKHVAFRDVMEDVFLHGDTWVNNIMFVKNDDGTMGNDIVAFLDWQISNKGCGVNDMARFETWCLNKDMRRANYESMLKVYYERLCEKAGDRIKFSFDDLMGVYKVAFIINGLMAVVFVDVMLKNIAKVDEDETGCRKIEILERGKAAYEDAAMFLGWS